MKIGAQMYTIREFCKTPEEIGASLQKLAEIGYRYVQMSGCGPIEPEQMRKYCDAAGIRVAATHVPYDRFINDTERLIADHEIMGCDSIGLGIMPKYARADYSGLEAFMKVFEEPVRKIKAAGKRVTYHNHAMEFVRMNGKLIFDHLLEHFPQDQLQIILDTYWVQAGGADIYQWIEKLNGRLTCVHLKDFAVDSDFKSPKMAPVGSGNMNFPAIIKAFEAAGAQYAFVEQDLCYGEDPFECLKKSFDYLKSIGCGEDE